MFVQGYDNAAEGDAFAAGIAVAWGVGSATATFAVNEIAASAMARKVKRRIVVLLRERLL
jgi:hypothetical protein